jgi:hypothetical protein
VDEATIQGTHLQHLEMQHCWIPPSQPPYADYAASTMSHSAEQNVCVSKPFSLSFSAPHTICARFEARQSRPIDVVRQLPVTRHENRSPTVDFAVNVSWLSIDFQRSCRFRCRANRPVDVEMLVCQQFNVSLHYLNLCSEATSLCFWVWVGWSRGDALQHETLR